MSLKSIFILLTLFLSLSAQAYELLVIQTVSTSRKTFVTRQGKRLGFSQGMTGTFTADDVSIIAKAIMVTGQFTQWEIVNAEAIVPFEKGGIVTYHPATEYLWALSPEKERRKYIKSQLKLPRKSWIFKGGLAKGISESVSSAPANPTQRISSLGEILYERDFYENFAFDLGLRYEKEIINYPGTSLTTLRNLAMVDLIYYFDFLQDWVYGARFFLSLGAGIGVSQTSTIISTQSGNVVLAPSTRAGVSLRINDSWDFILDGAFESMNTREEQSDGKIQTTTQTNFRMGAGLRRFF
jgi:hypothetical protein